MLWGRRSRTMQGMSNVTDSTSTTIERINPSDVTEIPGIHHVLTVPSSATTVLVGGQVALDEEGGFPTTDFTEQVRLAARNLRRCLRAADADVADLVRVRAYVVGLTPERVEQFQHGLLTELPEWTGPATTLLGVDALFVPEALIEIDAEAVVVRA